MPEEAGIEAKNANVTGKQEEPSRCRAMRRRRIDYETRDNDVGKRRATDMCEKLETGWGEKGRFRAAAETLAWKLGRGQLDSGPEQAGAARALGSGRGGPFDCIEG